MKHVKGFVYFATHGPVRHRGNPKTRHTHVGLKTHGDLREAGMKPSDRRQAIPAGAMSMETADVVAVVGEKEWLGSPNRKGRTG
jgi:hypothetical protein